MSTRKIAAALGAAVLLLGAPASYALAGEGEPDRPAKVEEYSDGVDVREDGPGDPDRGSPSEDSASPEEPAEEPGGGGETPDPAAAVQAVVEEVLANLPAGPPPPA